MSLIYSLRVLLTAIIVLYPSLAMASSGYVTGTLKFHQRNGNYCPTGSDCTDARYTSSSWNQQVGIPEAIIRLEKADGTLIAQSSTDAAGKYAFAWSVDTNGASPGTGTANVAAQIVLLYLHKDSAFQYRTFANVGSKLQYFSLVTLTLTHGNGVGTPQTFNKTWGTAAGPGRSRIATGLRTWPIATCYATSRGLPMSTSWHLSQRRACLIALRVVRLVTQ